LSILLIILNVSTFILVVVSALFRIFFNILVGISALFLIFCVILVESGTMPSQPQE
jgi:hypothetical protein